MLVSLPFLFLAGKCPADFIAGIFVMDMFGIILQAADGHPFFCVTVIYMGMALPFFFLTGKLPILCIAGICVSMGFRLFLAADISAVIDPVTAFRMLVFLDLFKGTYQPAILITALRMLMDRIIRITTDQIVFSVITFSGMNMQFLRKCADKFKGYRFFTLIPGSHFTADCCLAVTLFCMGMFLQSAYTLML